jgi:hypothetical protein
MEEGIWLQQNLHRIKSLRRRTIIERKLNRYRIGMEAVIKRGREKRKKK